MWLGTTILILQDEAEDGAAPKQNGAARGLGTQLLQAFAIRLPLDLKTCGMTRRWPKQSKYMCLMCQVPEMDLPLLGMAKEEEASQLIGHNKF